MIVFKLYLRILNKNRLFIFIYFGIFIIMTLSMMSSYKASPANFNNVKVDVAFYDEDNTEFTRNLKEYLSSYGNFKEIDKDILEDAFFFRDIEMIVKIPSGFTDNFNSPNEKLIETRIVPESSTAFSFQQALNRYLNLAKTYMENDLETDDLHQSISNILEKEAKVSFPEVERTDYFYAQFYYNYIAYIVLAIIITITGLIMLSFKSIEVRRRNSIASISNQKLNLILIFSNALLSIGFLLALIILSIILYPDVMLKTNGLLLMLSSFIFTLSVIALAYLVVSLFNSKNVIGAIGTILSLGSSFITGIFIPQEFLDKSILTFAKILPSYWYVNSNDRIVNLTTYTFDVMKPIYINFIVLICFTFVFIIGALVISFKRQRTEA